MDRNWLAPPAASFEPHVHLCGRSVRRWYSRWLYSRSRMLENFLVQWGGFLGGLEHFGFKVARLRPSTAVDKTVFQCTKSWIEKEAPVWVVEVVSSGGFGVILAVLVFIFNFDTFWPLRGQSHENPFCLFDSYVRIFSSVVAVSRLFLSETAVLRTGAAGCPIKNGSPILTETNPV